MADKQFPGLDRLIQHANRVSGRKPDSVELLARMIALATDDGADPYLVLGVLIEGAVRTLDKHVPEVDPSRRTVWRLVKLGSGCCQAANLSLSVAPYASSGVRPSNVEWGLRSL